MDRLTVFEGFKSHPWLRRVYAKLTAADLAIVRAFIQDNRALDKVAFERAAVRLFLDKSKPKNWTAIEELLVCANSSTHQ